MALDCDPVPGRRYRHDDTGEKGEPDPSQWPDDDGDYRMLWDNSAPSWGSSFSWRAVLTDITDEPEEGYEQRAEAERDLAETYKAAMAPRTHDEITQRNRQLVQSATADEQQTRGFRWLDPNNGA